MMGDLRKKSTCPRADSAEVRSKSYVTALSMTASIDFDSVQHRSATSALDNETK